MSWCKYKDCDGPTEEPQTVHPEDPSEWMLPLTTVVVEENQDVS